MTPEREAQMRAAFEKWRKDLIGNPDLTKDAEGYYEDWDTQVAWSGFLACARALEPMVRDGERYAWIKANAYVTFHEEQEWPISNDQTIYSRMPAAKELDKAVDAAMSAALEDGNADV